MSAAQSPARKTYANEKARNNGIEQTTVKGITCRDDVDDNEFLAQLIASSSFTIVLPLDDASCGLDMTHDAIKKRLERLQDRNPGIKLKVSTKITAPTFERHGFDQRHDKNLGLIRRQMNGMEKWYAELDIQNKGNMDRYKDRKVVPKALSEHVSNRDLEHGYLKRKEYAWDSTYENTIKDEIKDENVVSSEVEEGSFIKVQQSGKDKEVAKNEPGPISGAEEAADFLREEAGEDYEVADDEAGAMEGIEESGNVEGSEAGEDEFGAFSR